MFNKYVSYMHCINIHLLTIENGGYHLSLNVKINDKSAYFILDTGASKTVLDKNQIHLFNLNQEIELLEEKSTGLGTNSMDIHQTKIDLLEIGDKKIENISLAIIDLSHVNETYEKLGFKKIQGVLGSDLLHQYKAIIDYKSLKLFLD